MFLDYNAYYWIYSTIAQSLAALIGISGVFAVFRFQMLENEISKSIQNIKDFINEIHSWVSPEVGVMSEEGLIQKAQEIINRVDKNIETNEVEERELQSDLNGGMESAFRIGVEGKIKELKDTKKNELYKRNEMKYRKEKPFKLRDHRRNMTSMALILISYLIFVFLCSIIGLVFSEFPVIETEWRFNFLIFVIGLLIYGLFLLFRFCKISLNFGISRSELTEKAARL